jgi:putative tRNA adenosine deaminase-associated protein
MSEGAATQTGEEVDFALAVYREEGHWEVEALPPRVGTDLELLLATLRQRPGDGGALGLVSVDEDFFVVLRVRGEDVRLLLSDVTAATEWPLARAVLDLLSIPPPQGEDEEHVQPAGDLSLLTDLGLATVDMAALCDDLDLYPEEVLGQVAERLGFGQAYDRALDTALH